MGYAKSMRGHIQGRMSATMESPIQVITVPATFATFSDPHWLQPVYFIKSATKGKQFFRKMPSHPHPGDKCF
jgi:hypothetical protein